MLGRSLPFPRGPVTRAHPRVTDVGRFDDAKVGNHLLYHIIPPLFPFSDLWYLVMVEDAVELALEAALVPSIGMWKLCVEGANDCVPFLVQVHTVEPNECLLLL